MFNTLRRNIGWWALLLGTVSYVLLVVELSTETSHYLVTPIIVTQILSAAGWLWYSSQRGATEAKLYAFVSIMAFSILPLLR